MKKFQVVLGLAVMVAMLWAVASPVNAEVKLLTGGWVLVPCGTPCNGVTEEPCRNGPAWTVPLCSPFYDTWVCISGSSGWGLCTSLGYDECDAGGYDCPGEETGCS